MKLKVFTLRYDPDAGGFDDEPLQRFLAHKRVVAVHEHFFHEGGVPSWALLVTYQELPDPTGRPARGAAGRKGQPALAPEDEALYEVIRKWRNDRARRQGRPVYVMLDNAQIAAVARQRPATLEELGRIDGVGGAKLSDFGEELLQVVKTAGRADPTEQAEQAPAEPAGAPQ